MGEYDDLAAKWQELTVAQRINVLIDAYNNLDLCLVDVLLALHYARDVAQEDGWRHVPPNWWVGKTEKARQQNTPSVSAKDFFVPI